MFKELFEATNYKDIVNDFDTIDTVIQVHNTYVQVTGEKDGKYKKELYKYKNKEVAKEVTDKVKNFKGI